MTEPAFALRRMSSDLSGVSLIGGCVSAVSSRDACAVFDAGIISMAYAVFGNAIAVIMAIKVRNLSI